MSKTLICNAVSPIDGELKHNISVLIDENEILQVDYKGDVPEDTEVFDAEGGYLVPSFIELHAHGGGTLHLCPIGMQFYLVLLENGA